MLRVVCLLHGGPTTRAGGGRLCGCGHWCQVVSLWGPRVPTTLGGRDPGCAPAPAAPSSGSSVTRPSGASLLRRIPVSAHRGCPHSEAPAQGHLNGALWEETPVYLRR